MTRIINNRSAIMVMVEDRPAFMRDYFISQSRYNISPELHVPKGADKIRQIDFADDLGGQIVQYLRFADSQKRVEQLLESAHRPEPDPLPVELNVPESLRIDRYNRGEELDLDGMLQVKA